MPHARLPLVACLFAALGGCDRSGVSLSRIDPALSQATPSLTRQTANGSDRVTITVIVRDAGGDPLAGQLVHLEADGMDLSITQPGVTDADGVATGWVASGTPGLAQLRVVANPGPFAVTLAEPVMIEFASVGRPAAGFASRRTLDLR